MKKTFTLIAIAIAVLAVLSALIFFLKPDYSGEILGTWKSSLDENYSVTFEKDSVRERYGLDLETVGTWKFLSSEEKKNYKNISKYKAILTTDIDGEKYFYGIINVDEKELVMVDLDTENQISLIKQ